jgi:hypothetical protein
MSITFSTTKLTSIPVEQKKKTAGEPSYEVRLVKGALLRLLDRPRPWMAEAELPWTALLRVQQP